MSPRPGGEADKLGNKYEAAWAIRHALYCLLDERRSLTLEDVDAELGQGSEFTYVTGTTTEVYQLKRQNGDQNFWSIKALAGRGILEAAAAHVAAGREYHFVSLIPCGPLNELAERARKSADLATFTQDWLTSKLRDAFDELSAADNLGNPESAWRSLRGMWFEVHGERDVIQVNRMLAEMSLDGSTGHLMSLALGGILLDSLGKRLTRSELLEELAHNGIAPRSAGSRTSAREQIRAVTDSWRGSVRRELLQPPIERAEAEQLVAALGSNRISLVVGKAGDGKSSVLEQAVASLETSGAEVVALRLDRLEAFGSTIDLGRQLGLDTSPAAELAVAADGGDAYLVIDQIDAVSLASGRMPESFDVIMDLIGEALSVAGVRVILACREFDVENDHRIRALAGRPDMSKVRVGELPVDAVEAAVSTMGLEPARLTASQRALLQAPLHLVLLSTIASQSDALAFHSKGSLFEAFWERKRQTARARRDGVRFNEVVSYIANAASDRQTLSVPIELLDDDDLIEDANVLVSEHVLAREGDRIAFFHEAFFDYAFARRWVSRSESLVDFLHRDEQELFRRAQVRQILQHLHERDPDRFIDEVEAVLTRPDIRFHIKETVLAVLATLTAPTSDELALVLRVAETRPQLADRMWQQLNRPQWFLRLHDDGVIATWLDSTEQALKERAINAMVTGVKEDHGDVVAELLRARQAAPEYLAWLRRVVRFGDVHNNRQLFDLLLTAVRQGDFDAAEQELWRAVDSLAKHQPLWAIELLQARLIDHVNAFALTNDGKVVTLAIREYGATELVREASTAEPLTFAQTIVPYLRDVMTATASLPSADEPIRDKHFSVRFPATESEQINERDLDEALLDAATRSLETLAPAAVTDVQPILQDLADDPHEASQFLLYRGLTAGGATFAEWAAELLLEGGQRLDCGYFSDPHWVARELVRAIAPHVSGKAHRQLEDQFRDLRDPREGRQSAGWSAFTFLSALDESRLSPEGERRLGEYRRKFAVDAPAAPRGIEVGSIGSPISADAASKMTDEQWLGAVAKHNTDTSDLVTFTGGAGELSHVLQDCVATQSSRFARLALRMTPNVNPAYGDAMLRGFGAAEASEENAALIFDGIRHIASFGHISNDRWLGMALRRYYRKAPLDLVELIRDRALHSGDPADDKPIFVRDGYNGKRAERLYMNGINTARGSLSEALGNLLVYDADGERTALVRPQLKTLASDPVLSVRSCAAHTVAASLRHARADALEAFEQLIDADDVLLAAGNVQQLMIYIGNVNPDIIDPVIQRMLASENDEVRKVAGVLAAFAALEWGRPELMAQALSADAWVRTGVAQLCARNVDRSSSADLATSSLVTLMHDNDNEVRKAVANVAPHLRERPLRPFAQLLNALIDSPSYNLATPQLLITLQHSPDKVDDLVLTAAQRFLDIHGEDAADIRTAAAGDAHYISELVVRGLAQSRDPQHRAALLDALDHLLQVGVYGIGDAIATFERR